MRPPSSEPNNVSTQADPNDKQHYIDAVKLNIIDDNGIVMKIGTALAKATIQTRGIVRNKEVEETLTVDGGKQQRW